MATVVVMLPVLLTAALSVPIRSELGFDELGLGVSTAAFFAASALSSVGGGWLAHRTGSRVSVAVGVATSVAATAAIGLLATRLSHLVLLLSVAGVANAITQPGAGLVLATVVPVRQQGLAFGISQMSAPLATVMAGVTMPTIALTAGWRWAFALSPLLAALLVAVWPRGSGRGAAPQDGGAAVVSSSARSDLLTLAAVTALAATAVQAMTAFYVESAVTAGVAAGTAGWLLGGGSLCGVAMRVVYGWVADRRDVDRIRDVALLMTVGSAGILGLSAGSPVLVPATVTAFAAGWGWNGLLNYAVVRRYPRASALALGVVTTGVFVGGALGPLGFGLLALGAGYPVAWAAAAAALLLAGVLAHLVGRAPGHRRPPS